MSQAKRRPKIHVSNRPVRDRQHITDVVAEVDDCVVALTPYLNKKEITWTDIANHLSLTRQGLTAALRRPSVDRYLLERVCEMVDVSLDKIFSVKHYERIKQTG